MVFWSLGMKWNHHLNKMEAVIICMQSLHDWDHSYFCVEWDWEKIIDPAQRNVETLQAAVSPMTWCAGISANADLKDTIKSMCTELFEGKYADGAAFCAALDALYK